MGKSSEEYIRQMEELEAQRNKEQIELAERLEALYQKKKEEYEYYHSEEAQKRREQIEATLWKVFDEFHPLKMMK
jgi:hypothetical protein